MTKTYLVVYAKAQGSNFAGHAPDVLGCVSVGDTLEEMRAMMREALEFHFEGMLDHGEKLPEPVTINVEFRNEDFEGVEYFVVEHLNVRIPTHHDRHEALSA